MSYLFEFDPDNPLRPLLSVSFTYPIALWPRASIRMGTLIESGSLQQTAHDCPRWTSSQDPGTPFHQGKGGLKFLYP